MGRVPTTFLLTKSENTKRAAAQSPLITFRVHLRDWRLRSACVRKGPTVGEDDDHDDEYLE